MIRLPSPVVPLHWEDCVARKISLSIKREDLIHPVISGNKWRKLKYNIIHCRENGYKGILSFGGAFSNHLAALSHACNSYQLAAVGMIRGDNIDEQNPTIQFLRQEGMQLELVDRISYRKKSKPEFLLQLQDKYPDYFIVPEGGSNALALKGVGEIVAELDDNPLDYLCVSAGTAYTSIGILTHVDPDKVRKVLVFSSLKGDFLKHEIEKYKDDILVEWELVTDYHFGGYAKTNLGLISFINEFKAFSGIPLDPIYNGKMFYGLRDMIRKEKIAKASQVLVIHTGGIQGIAGHNYRYKDKEKMLLEV